MSPQTELTLLGGVAVIRLSRPPLNILTWDFRTEITERIKQCANENYVRVIVVGSSLEKAFSAGADIKEFADSMHPGGEGERSRIEHTAYDAIDFVPKPTICAVNGYCLGGGLELAMAFDIRIASEEATFGQPEIKLGCFPGGGGTERLALLVGRAKAKELMYTGASIDAPEAFRIGLVNRVVPAGRALDEAIKLAKVIAQHSPLALRSIKELVDAVHHAPDEMHAALPRVAERVEAVFQTEEVRSGANAFLTRHSRPDDRSPS
jgi:enoyl-CoA hydratase/carnithine racemase